MNGGKALFPFLTRPDCDLHLGVFPEPTLITHRIEDAPPFMNGLRALFISDVHLRPCVNHARLSKFIDRIAAQNASMLLLGGDYAETQEDCLRFFAALRELSFPLGAWAVPGNNDRWGHTFERALSESGICLLKNAVHTLTLPGGKLSIGGCDDHKYGQAHTAALFDDAPGAYRILLSHFPVRPNCECDLMLSGHTHAGQCNFLGITPYSLGFERRYRLCGVRGMQKIGGMRVFIGNGIGVSRVPLRLGAQPQMDLLKFSCKDFEENLAVKS